MPKKKSKKGKPQVHKELEGFDVTINEFGEIISNLSAEKVNQFLDKNVVDKKLKDREDLSPRKKTDDE